MTTVDFDFMRFWDETGCNMWQHIIEDNDPEVFSEGCMCLNVLYNICVGIQPQIRELLMRAHCAPRIEDGEEVSRVLEGIAHLADIDWQVGWMYWDQLDKQALKKAIASGADPEALWDVYRGVSDFVACENWRYWREQRTFMKPQFEKPQVAPTSSRVIALLKPTLSSPILIRRLSMCICDMSKAHSALQGCFQIHEDVGLSLWNTLRADARWRQLSESRTIADFVKLVPDLSYCADEHPLVARDIISMLERLITSARAEEEIAQSGHWMKMETQDLCTIIEACFRISRRTGMQLWKQWNPRDFWRRVSQLSPDDMLWELTTILEADRRIGSAFWDAHVIKDGGFVQKLYQAEAIEEITAFFRSLYQVRPKHARRLFDGFECSRLLELVFNTDNYYVCESVAFVLDLCMLPSRHTEGMRTTLRAWVEEYAEDFMDLRFIDGHERDPVRLTRTDAVSGKIFYDYIRNHFGLEEFIRSFKRYKYPDTKDALFQCCQFFHAVDPNNEFGWRACFV